MTTARNAAARDHLEAVGKTIYGEEFKAALAAALDIDARTLRRWLSGEIGLAWDHGVIADLRDLLAQEHLAALDHEEEIRHALADLDDAITYRRLCERYGGEQRYLMIADDPAPRAKTLQDYVRRHSQMQGEVSKLEKVVRDLKADLARTEKERNGGIMSFYTEPLLSK